MNIVTIPRVSTPIARKIYNLAKYGVKLSPTEQKYADKFTQEIRENINPWNADAKINTDILKEIQKEFREKIKADFPKRNKGMIRNVESHVFGIAKKHYKVMSKPENYELIKSGIDITSQIGKCSDECNTLLKAIDDISNQFLAKKISKTRFKETCHNLRNKLNKVLAKREKLVNKRDAVLASNETIAIKNGFYDSYNYVYKTP